MDYKKLINILGFTPKEHTAGIYTKKYPQHDGYCIDVNFDNESIDYGIIASDSKTTQNFSQLENFVVLECVDRLLTKGYSPKNIILEKTWSAGHGTSGRLDICVTRDDGTEYLLIECKTYGKEFDKELARMNKDGGQLFTYFKFSNKADVIMLYASGLQGKGIVYKNDIVKIEDDYRTGDVKDFYDKWNKLTKDNGVFESWVKPYSFESKALTISELEDIKPQDSSFIFNRFLEILRHNVVSDKPNAFNKIFTLFLCKIYDEKINEGTENELGFQWIEGVDDDISFQLRLTDLYKEGMWTFLDKKVTDFSDKDFDSKYAPLFSGDTKLTEELRKEISRLRLEKNNEFAIKEVYDEKSFKENAKVVKQVVELLQKYKIRYTKKQQYLSDFFEMLLTTGLKQESGQFFTPVPIAQFIIKSLPIDSIVEKKLKEGKKDELLPYIIDYAAGSGHFITESMHVIQGLLSGKDLELFRGDTKKFIDSAQRFHFDWALQYVYGIEKDYRLVKVGKVGCYLHGDGLANVIHSDGLSNFDHSDYKGKLRETDKDFKQENKQFDVVVSNPPYSVSAFKNAAREYYKDGDFELYERLTDNSSEIECLFVERTKQLLKDGGVAGVILPSSILSNTGIYTKAREVILQYFEIVAIAELGSNTFMATGTNTVVLFLRKRNNYDSINLRKSVESFFCSLSEVTLNGVENPVSKYISYAWEGISLSDYITLLKKAPNSAVEQSEMHQEYRKKIKVKSDKEFWSVVLETELEKLYYFILTYSQQVVIVRSGEKDAEKRFLGYEFSNRRGNEGIHAIERGKGIDECTQLFDADEFENPDKASTYVYKAFKGDFESPITESMQKNISRTRLVDMLNFDRVDFEKTISTNLKKKVRFDDIWGTSRLVLLSEVADIKKGTSITKDKTVSGSIPVIAGGQDVAYYHNVSNRDGNVITISASGAYSGFVNYFSEPIFASDCSTVKSKDESVISTSLIFHFLKAIQPEIYGLQRGQAQPHVYGEDIAKIKIPLPSKEVQEQIVAEIEEIDNINQDTNHKLKSLREQIDNILVSSSGIERSIASVCVLKAGKFVSPSDISPNFSEGLYQCFGGNGLRGYTKTYTNEGTYSLIGRQGALCGNICFASGTFHATEHAIVVYPNEGIQTKWLYYELKRLNLNQYAKGTAQPGLSVQVLNKVTIKLPSTTDQQKIVAKIEILDAKISELQQIIDNAPAQKAAILKKYL